MRTSADKRTITANAKLNQGTYVDGSGFGTDSRYSPRCFHGSGLRWCAAIYKAPYGARYVFRKYHVHLRPSDVPGAQLNTVSKWSYLRLTRTAPFASRVRETPEPAFEFQAAQINITGTGAIGIDGKWSVSVPGVTSVTKDHVRHIRNGFPVDVRTRSFDLLLPLSLVRKRNTVDWLFPYPGSTVTAKNAAGGRAWFRDRRRGDGAFTMPLSSLLSPRARC